MLCLGFLVTAGVGRADPAPPVRTIKKGEKAPADGVFYTNEAHAKLASKLQTQNKMCQLNKEIALQRQKAKLNSKVATLTIALEVEKKKLDLTRALLKDQKKLLLSTVPKRKTPWWKSPTFVFWSGFSAAIVVTGLATWGALEFADRKQ